MVSAPGNVLLLVVARIGIVHAREKLTSLQRGLLEICHRSRCEYAVQIRLRELRSVTHREQSESLAKKKDL